MSVSEGSNNTRLTLIKGNCVDVLGKIPSSSVDLIVTDPPYNLGIFMKDRDTNLNRMRENFFVGAEWDNLPYDSWMNNMNLFFKEVKRIVRKGGSIIIFMSVIRTESIIQLAQDNGLYYKTTGVWHKTNPMPRNMNLHFINSVESWIYFTNGTKTGTFNNNGEALHDFFECSVAPKSEKKYGGHPTQKPEKIVEWFVKTLSNPGDCVMDPFMGSGTTGVVAKRCGRSFIGIEILDTYFETALKRIADVRATDSCEELVVDEKEL